MVIIDGFPADGPLDDWQTIAIKMLRAMLNDSDSATYTDARLLDILITAAYFIVIDINFVTTYVIDVDLETITPDPTTKTDVDGIEFIDFMVLKAACLLDETNFRTAALLQGISAKCGPATLTTSSYGQYLATLLNQGPCKTYALVKNEYNFSYDGKKIIRAVMSPFVSNDFFPQNGESYNR